MIIFLNLVLRLTIWFLLTADLSRANIIIGLCIALLIPNFDPQSRRRLSLSAALNKLEDWLRSLGEIVMAIPQAYFEAFEMILLPHKQEYLTIEPGRPRRSPGLIFLDIFLITFTPKTIVVKYHEDGWHEVHWVQRRQRR
ncbi:MAG: cation:proton antiporter [Phormidesmis sp. RL_2_1]|nr:cation:proton antiporter [Phormidesmis sp. RL_2_1]